MPSANLGRALGTMLCLAAWAPLVASPPAETARPVKKPVASQFIRLKRDAGNRPIGLETAVVRYVPASGEGGLVVDLIGAVHVGDRSYYQKLNKQFEQYDALLYELVAPPGKQVPRKGRRGSNNPLALIQQLATGVLDLDSQMEQIDYTKKNFVHADLSPEQMAEAMRNRGEDGLTLFLGIAADLLRQQNVREREREKNSPGDEPEDMDVLALLLDPDGAAKLKRLLAEQLAELSSMSGGLGTTLNTLLVTDRNEAAMKVFQRELAKSKKKIGIFYGVAHLPDFEKRLRADFGLKRQGERWVTAWDLRPKQNGLESIFKLFER